jgi:hypothetical protein
MRKKSELGEDWYLKQRKLEGNMQEVGVVVGDLLAFFVVSDFLALKICNRKEEELKIG